MKAMSRKPRIVGRFATTLAVLAAVCGIGAADAGAIYPGWQSGWILGGSAYARGCNSKIFAGRDSQGRLYAFAKTTNPACAVKVRVTLVNARKPGVAESGWGSSVGVLYPSSHPYGTFEMVTVIPAFNWTMQTDSWFSDV